MDVRQPSDAQSETMCPDCGVRIDTHSVGRRRRVQCPRCREIVELAPPRKPAATPPNAATLPPDLLARLERLDALERRVAVLEKAAVPGEAELFGAAAGLPPGAARDRRWKWRPQQNDALADPVAIEQNAEALLHNLRTFERRNVTIRVPTGNPAARQRADALKSVFDLACWNVAGPSETNRRGETPGLCLAVGALPLPEDAVATYFALTASGFRVNSVLDPNLARDETILFVA
jgi:hypothetical protein